MIPLAVPNLTGNEARYLQECILSTYVSSVGPFVTQFEEVVARCAGAPLAVAVASGTAALHVALRAVGVGRDDLVLTPSLTFIASGNAVSYCGAEPWLVDVAPDRWTLDPLLLATLLAEETVAVAGGRIRREDGRRVAAILPVYTLGTPAAMMPITALAKEYGLPVVADAAAALGAREAGQPVGAMDADLTVFSFNGNKTFTCGGGGAVVGQDPERMALVRHLSTTARRGEEYDHDVVGFNYRMTNLQAAVGCAQLERMDDFLAAKRRIRQEYDAALGDLPGISLFPQPPGVESACWLSGLLLPAWPEAEIREMRATLRQRGVDARPFWKPLHRQPPYMRAPRTAQPVSEGLWQRILTLPCSTALSPAEQMEVITAVREAWKLS